MDEELAARVTEAVRRYGSNSARIWTVNEINEVTTVAGDIGRLAVSVLGPELEELERLRETVRGGVGCVPGQAETAGPGASLGEDAEEELGFLELPPLVGSCTSCTMGISVFAAAIDEDGAWSCPDCAGVAPGPRPGAKSRRAPEASGQMLAKGDHRTGSLTDGRKSRPDCEEIDWALSGAPRHLHDERSDRPEVGGNGARAHLQVLRGGEDQPRCDTPADRIAALVHVDEQLLPRRSPPSPPVL
ncbi:MAG: hypothetical protein ACRDJF_13105 [Actinomycetota bacterium]